LSKWVRRLFARKKPKKNRITIADLEFIRDRLRDAEARRAFTRAIREMEDEEKK